MRELNRFKEFGLRALSFVLAVFCSVGLAYTGVLDLDTQIVQTAYAADGGGKISVKAYLLRIDQMDDESAPFNADGEGRFGIVNNPNIDTSCLPSFGGRPGSDGYYWFPGGNPLTITVRIEGPGGWSTTATLMCTAPGTHISHVCKYASGPMPFTYDCGTRILEGKFAGQSMKGSPESEPEECTGEVEIEIVPPPPGYVQPNKYSAAPQFNTGNENYDLAGATFMCIPGEPSTAETTGGDRVWHGNSKDAYSEFVEFTVDPAGPFTLQEISPPKGFAGNDDIVEDEVAPDEHKQVEFVNEPYRSPVRLLLTKHDREYEFDITDPDERDKYDDDSKNVQGDGMLSGAVFEVRVYCNQGEFVAGQQPIIQFKANSKDVKGKDQAILDFAYSDVYDFVNNADNSFTKEDYFVDNPDAFSFPLGYVVVTEIKAPVGYTLEDPNQMCVIDTKNPDNIIIGPQFAFEVTTEGATLSGGNSGPVDENSPDGDSVTLQYIDPTEFQAMVKLTESEAESAIEIANKFTEKAYYTILSNGKVAVHVCRPMKDSYVPGDGRIYDYARITKEFTPYEFWLREYGKIDGVFTARYDTNGNIIDVGFPTEAQIAKWFGSQFDYVIQGTVDAFNFDSATKTYVKAGTKKANNKTITVNGIAPAIQFESKSVKYGDQTYPGVYYFQNKDGRKIYLTARPNGWLTENGMPGSVSVPK